MPIITLPAKIEKIEEATGFLDAILEEAGCSMRAQIQLDIALDEMMSNVARYAYASGEGDITIAVDILDDRAHVVLTLMDNGVPYDPLKKDDPDITLSAEERKIGGLGIFIVKQSMDSMTYAYENGQNAITMVKRIKEE